MFVDAEFWDTRNKAILTLTELVSKWEDSAQCHVAISSNVYRALRDPVISMVIQN